MFNIINFSSDCYWSHHMSVLFFCCKIMLKIIDDKEIKAVMERLGYIYKERKSCIPLLHICVIHYDNYDFCLIFFFVFLVYFCSRLPNCASRLCLQCIYIV